MTTIRTFAAFVIFALTIIAIPASATTRPSIEVTVNHALIERELGTCDAGREVWVHVGSHSQRVVEHASIPMSYRSEDSLSISVEMNCGGRDERLPDGSVDIAFSN
ncbi:hypothetical protein IT407_01200 [Candidatus Uhrbacteria bacterium]|nr:hypothetical protein [Candidatus Uhrbacteria bacterium]